MARMTRRFIGAIALFAVAAAALAASPVAFVTDVQGDVKQERAGRVAFLAEIPSEAKLVLEKGARLTLMYSASGTEFVLTGPGEFVVGPAEVRAVQGAAPARRTVAVRPEASVVARVSQSATASLRMRGAPPVSTRTGPLYPRNAQVASGQPVLRWAGEPGPEGFEVIVATSDGKDVWKGPSRESALRLPVKLAAATRYSWSVSGGGRQLGDAAFETLPAEAMARAEKSRAASKSFSDRVVHAFVLQDLGAAQDAREAWAELARERPDLPELAVLAR